MFGSSLNHINRGLVVGVMVALFSIAPMNGVSSQHEGTSTTAHDGIGSTHRPNPAVTIPPTSVPTTGHTSCSEVQQIFAMKHIGPISMVPDTAVEGNPLEICSVGKASCCTKKTEERYREAVKKDFFNVMQGSSSNLKNLIATHAAKFQEGKRE